MAISDFTRFSQWLWQ